MIVGVDQVLVARLSTGLVLVQLQLPHDAEQA